MQKDLDPETGDTFHFKLKQRRKKDTEGNEYDDRDCVLWWENGVGTDVYFNSGAKTHFMNLLNAILDQKLFHELTHEQGTLDQDAKEDCDNADIIENLMNVPLSRWPVLDAARKLGKK